MFEEFFHLRENPFALAPNPRFIFQSHEHVEALAHFRYWIENGEGFVLITGEVGTGKTTALFDLMAQLPDEWSVGFVANSSLAAHELLEEVCRRFRIDVPPGATRPTLLAKLENYLAEREDHGLRSLLILDEAQNFETRLLEEVRLLSNLERATGKLLQIALVGQPELDRKLELPELRQLRQRIGIRYRLGPLSEEECVRYIHHRVAVAGGDAEQVFPVETGLAVYRLTHGIPREINVVSSQALITAFVQGAESVRPEHVQAVVEEFNWSSIFGREVPAPRPRRPRMSEGPGAGIGPRPPSSPAPASLGRPARPQPIPPASAPAVGSAGAREHSAPGPAGAPSAGPFPAGGHPAGGHPASPGGVIGGALGQPKAPPTRIDAIRPRPALEVVRGRGAEKGPLDPQAAPESASGHAGEPPSARTELPIVRSDPEPMPRPEPTLRSEPMPRPEPGQRPEPGYRGEPGHRGEPLHRPEPRYRAESAPRAESAAPSLRPRPPAEAPRRPMLLAESEPPRRPWLLIAGIALLLLLFVGGSFWFKAQNARKSAEPRSPRPTGAAPTPAAAVADEPPAGREAPPGTSETPAHPSPDAASPTAAGGSRAAAGTANPRPKAAAAKPAAAAASDAQASSGSEAPVSQDPEYAILAASFVGDAVRVAEVRREYELKFGLPVAVVRVDWGGSQWRNRVYVGSYGTRAAAEQARRSLVTQGQLGNDSLVRSFSNATEGVPAP